MKPIQQKFIAENIASIQEEIEAAAQKTGRLGRDICLIAVTKYVDVDLTQMVLESGCRHLGESRPQQLWEKASALSSQEPNWHMIGHLQRNKVRRTLPSLSCIHSIDSLRLLASLDEECRRQGKEIEGLLEVNVSGDVSKTGMTEDDAKLLLDRRSEYPQVKLTGVMGMASRSGNLSTAQQEFSSLREIRDRLQSHGGADVKLDELSMGMSHDFAQAIAEGATMVRIGSRLFQGLDRP